MDTNERKAIKQWLDENWKHGPCPVCQTNVWVPMFDEFAQIENLDRVTGRVPTFLIFCQNCGYLLMINAIAAGIRKVPQRVEHPSEAIRYQAEGDD
jgi:C4-type Zn-finger protein